MFLQIFVLTVDSSKEGWILFTLDDLHDEKDFNPNGSASSADAVGTTGSENLDAATSSKPAPTEEATCSEPCSTSCKPLTAGVTLGPNAEVECKPSDRQDHMPLFLRMILESDGATSSALHEAQASFIFALFFFVQCINCIQFRHSVCIQSLEIATKSFAGINHWWVVSLYSSCLVN
jgi:hypothetical protein